MEKWRSLGAVLAAQAELHRDLKALTSEEIETRLLKIKTALDDHKTKHSKRVKE